MDDVNDLSFDEYTLFRIDGREYAAWPDSALSQWSFEHSLPYRLVTVFEVLPERSITAENVRSLIQDALVNDDVFDLKFLSGVIFQSPSEQYQVKNSNVLDCLKSYGCSWTIQTQVKGSTDSLTPGPYVLRHSTLWRVCRLYDDTANAYLVSFKPTFNGRFEPLPIGNGNYQSRKIAVSSRFGQCANRRSSVAGYRVTVKDMFEINGMPTSLSSRAYLEQCPKGTQDAAVVRDLHELGVNITGLTQLCALVLYSEPTQSIDFQAPFNPRADGYQSPSGGNSGQAAAVATYNWLDIAIGSDSTKSARMPAQANGVFSLRPTKGMISTEGMWSPVPMFDTPCLFSRSLTKLECFAEAWYGARLAVHAYSPNRPYEVICFSEHLQSNEQHMEIFSHFRDELCSYLRCQSRLVSLDKEWNANVPVKAMNQSFEEYLNAAVSYHGYVYNFRQKMEPFLHEYSSKFGKEPFIPPPRGKSMWDEAFDVTPEQHREALHRITVYKQWLLEEVLCVKLKQALVLMPLEDIRPNYRDVWPKDAPNPHQSVRDPLLLAPVLGAPELVVPAGEITYHSRISGRDEALPVCVSVMGAPGADLSVIAVLQAFFKEKNWASEVEVGRYMFKKHE